MVQDGTAHTSILALSSRPQRARGAVRRQLRYDVKLTGDARRMAGQQSGRCLRTGHVSRRIEVEMRRSCVVKADVVLSLLDR